MRIDYFKTMPVALILLFALLCGVPQRAIAQSTATFKSELASMYVRDQDLRNEYGRLLQSARTESNRALAAELQAKAERTWQDTVALDAQNQLALDALIAQYGWPRKAEVGAIGMTTLYLVVQHADLAYQLRYLPQLRNAAETGEIAKSQLALLEDRILLRQGKPQRYGSQVDTQHGVTLRPTEDDAQLDQRRKAVGLEPICAYLMRFKAVGGAITYAPCLTSAQP